MASPSCGSCARLQRKGKVLVVVDQPASIGTLAVTLARACGCEVAYLPGLSMRRLADLHPGTGRSDARDAYVIADAARTMPHLLHSIDPDESVRAELTMVLGHDDDLAQDATRNRLRGLLTSIRPALERFLGPRLRHPAVLALLQVYGSPTQLAQAGTEQIAQVMLRAADAQCPHPGRPDHHRPGRTDSAGPRHGLGRGDHLRTPTTRRSGTSIRGEGPPRGGNKTLKRALFLASFASLSTPESRTYYDKKRAEKKRHNAALICLTRRRVDVLHAMLKHRTPYQPGHEQTA